MGYSTLVRLPTREGEGGFESLCRILAGPLWCKLDRTVEHDRLAH